MRNFAFFYGERKSSKTKFYSLSSLDIMVLRNSTPSFVRQHLTEREQIHSGLALR